MMVLKIKLDNGDMEVHEGISSFRYFDEIKKVSFVKGASQLDVPLDSASVIIGTSMHELDYPVYEFLSEHEKKIQADREEAARSDEAGLSKVSDVCHDSGKIAVAYVDWKNEEQIEEFEYTISALHDGTPVYDLTTITEKSNEELTCKIMQEAMDRVPEKMRTDETLELMKIMFELKDAK